ncbi:NnrU family protein [Roseovarius salis]|uniref:NnrU family protein n=1 Tax=Roseovarius salis TaxID=3376063 RepID=UPI0037C85E29
MNWTEFILAFATFFLTHSLPIRPPLRPWLVARLGAAGFTLAYSVLSVTVLGWVIVAAGRAPYVPVWSYAPWQNHVPLAAMAGVFVLLALAAGRPNPFSFGGPGAARFDPARPGIVRITRHPLLLALALWALAHLVPNGDLAHVITFGVFGGFALLGMPLVTRRKKRELGPRWAALDAATRAAAPVPSSWAGAGLRLITAAALYVGLLAAHPLLFGVSPLP